MLVIVFTSQLLWATGKQEKKEVSKEGHPSTWIANRHIKGRIFLENDGELLPKDQVNNPVAQKIKEMTGITLTWRSTGYPNGLEELTMALASGDIPDVIVSYLDHSGRPEFPVLLKAAREGMFADIRPYLEKTKILSKYITDPNFASKDTRENIMLRKDFNGAIYFVHMNLLRSGIKDSERIHWRFGPWIREDIAKALNIGPKDIKTQDDLYNVLLRIKKGNFKDANGKAVYPLGPRLWGGYWISTVVRNYDFGNGTRFDVDSSGKVKYLLETDYAWKQVKFYRKLLEEGLIHPEYFTMDEVRCKENTLNGSFGVIPWSMARKLEYKVYNYIPFEMINYKGEQVVYEKEKPADKVWAISAKAKNPEEIVKFADFLASKEGKALWYYGLKGVDYTIKDGKYLFTPKWLEFTKTHPEQVKDVIPTFWGALLGSTWLNHKKDFGELWVGLNSDKEDNKLLLYDMNYGNPKFKYWKGTPAPSYLSKIPDVEFKLKPVLDEYRDIMAKAVYAKSDEEAKKILSDYLENLKKSGLDDFKKLLQDQYDKDPDSIAFYIDGTY